MGHAVTVMRHVTRAERSSRRRCGMVESGVPSSWHRVTTCVSRYIQEGTSHDHHHHRRRRAMKR